MSLGEYIRAARLRRNLSQWELSKLSGLSRSHLSRLELDDYQRPSAQTFLALAKGLRIQPDELYQAAGYAANTRSRRSPPHTATTQVAGSVVRTLAAIPVIEEIKSGDVHVVGYTYFGLSEKVSDNTIGVLVKGFHLKPHIQEGDVIIIEQGMQPSPGNIVLCQKKGKIELKRFSEGMDYKGNGNGNCQIYGVVIGVNKSLI